MLTRNLIAAALALVLTIAAVPASAQEVATDPDLTALLQQVEREGWHIRALLAGQDTVEGGLRLLSRDELTVDGVRVALRDLRSLERRRADPGGVSHGALLGGAIGLASGILLFTPFAERFGTNPNEVRLVATSTFVGAAIGATIGGILTIGRVRWELIWRR